MLSSFLKAVRLGVEYKDALELAIDEANNGANAADILTTFTDATGTKLDDRAAEVLIGLVQDLQKKLPEIDKSKDELLEAITYYWPLFQGAAYGLLDKAEQYFPVVLIALRTFLDKLEERVDDVESLFASADLAFQLIEEQLSELTDKDS